MIGNGNGVNFQMAIYDDTGGVPNNLVTNTTISSVGTGIVSLPVAPVQLEPGDYWIMAIYEGDGNHSNVNQNSQRSPVYYNPLPFGSPIPPNASGFSSYTGQDFLYFATIRLWWFIHRYFKGLGYRHFSQPHRRRHQYCEPK